MSDDNLPEWWGAFWQSLQDQATGRPRMKLWLISQDASSGYDTYDAVVVAATTEDDARRTHPYGEQAWGGKWSEWCATPEQVTVKLLGDAAEGVESGVVLASFNAG